MLYSDICNSPWMYAWVMVLLALAMAQSLVFMRKAWKHGREIGFTSQELRNGLRTGITVSILPTLPVLLVFISLVQLLGTPLTWLRLSIIGSAHYEAYAASLAVESMGEQLVLNGYSINGWTAAAWVMTIGGSVYVLGAIIGIKPVSKLYNKAEQIDLGLVAALGTGCLTGIMGFVSVAYGFAAMDTKGIVFLISFAVGALIVFIHHKCPKNKWLMDFCMSISMVIAMVAACFIFQ